MASGWASDEAVNQQINSTINDGVERVRKALGQGESEHYCQECGEEIPEARRDALKGVRFCLVCQTEIDKQQKKIDLYNRRGSKDSQLR